RRRPRPRGGGPPAVAPAPPRRRGRPHGPRQAPLLDRQSWGDRKEPWGTPPHLEQGGAPVPPETAPPAPQSWAERKRWGDTPHAPRLGRAPAPSERPAVPG